MKIPLIIALLIPASCLLTPGAERPNILLIYTDDQGYGDASCLNPEAKFRTPNLDRLAREGVTLTDGHSPDTVCTPSRYGLLTGRYSWRTHLKRGVFGAERECLIAQDRVTLGSLLAEHGYATAMVGKWHLGMDFPGEWGKRDWTKAARGGPNDRGFEYFWGIPASMNYGVLAWFEDGRAAVPPLLYTRKKPNGIALSDYRIMPPYEAVPRGKADLEVAEDFTDVDCLQRFTDRALEWLGGRAGEARSGKKPFFLYLPLTSPHKPVIPREKFRGRGEAGAYGEFMIETDHHVGRLLDWLDEEELARDSLVIYTSDNGPETTWKQRLEKFGHRSNGIYREGKRSIYEGGHRVPFLVRWPAQLPDGVKLDAPICQTDLLATVAEIIGAKLPADAGEDSNSFLAELRDPAAAGDRPAIVHHAANGRFAIREGSWKLVMPGRRRGGKLELYQLDRDPGETRNLAGEHPRIVKRLTEGLTEIVESGRSSPGARAANDTGPWPDLTWMTAAPKN